jgi:hypothetical protein
MREMDREVKRRTEMLEYLRWKEGQATRQNPFSHRDVGRVVASYYKDPQAALEEARAEMGRGKSPPTASGSVSRAIPAQR